MDPHQSLDIFRMREIEQQLTAELLRAKEQFRTAITEEEKHNASELRDRALQRLTAFVARRIVPKEFLQE
jgi:glucose-6-phosphate-specific signal transduction histidine kinase